MKFLFLSIEFSLGTFSGNGIYATSQVRALRSLGHQVLVICGCPLGSFTAATAAHQIIPISLPIWGRLDAHCSWQDYAVGCVAPHVVDAVIRFAADACIAVDWHAFPAYEKLAEALKARGHAAAVLPPYVCSNYRVYLRTAATEVDVEIYRRLEGASLTRSICATVLSSSDEDYVQSSYHIAAFSPPPLHVLLPALRADIAAIPPPATSSSPRYLLSCCVRASPEKEPHRFIDLACVLQQRGVFERLGVAPLVAGAGWGVDPAADPSTLTEVQRYAHKLRCQLQAAVPTARVVDSFQGPAEMAAIYAETLLNVHPATYDAYGMTVVEAASQGAPSIVNMGNHVGATNLLDPGAGKVLEMDMEADAEALATRVEILLKDRVGLEKVGAAAQQTAREWTEKANAGALVKLIVAAMEQKSGGRFAAPSAGAAVAINGKEQHNLAVDAKPAAPPELSHPFSRGGVDVRAADSLQYHDFIEQYLARNRPVLISGVTQSWRAAKDWVVLPNDTQAQREDQSSENAVSEVDIDYLERNFGGVKIMATDTAPRHQGSGPCREMTLAEYCRWWRERKSRKESEKEIDDAEGGQPLWYLKDWHFLNNMRGDPAPYEPPAVFRDDWLNEWYDHKAQNSGKQPENATGGGASEAATCDYRFLYLGPAGSSTPLHADVLRSHSWSANIAGRKCWRLLPAPFAELVFDAAGISHAHDFFAADAQAFPRLLEAQKELLEVVQYPGEALFVPSNWFHTVMNLDDCLSINHNWISSHSVRNSWEFLQGERRRAAMLIEDCRELTGPAEFEFLVQRNTGSNAGKNGAAFGAMLRFIAAGAAEKLRSGGSGGSPAWATADDAIFRLKQAKAVLKELLMEQNEVFEQCSIMKISEEEMGNNNDDVGAAEEEARDALAAEMCANTQCLRLIAEALMGRN